MYIIQMYIYTIKVLKIIDPSVVLLEIVSEPIQNYFRGRADTVRCLVNMILKEESELYNELGDTYIRAPEKMF